MDLLKKKGKPIRVAFTKLADKLKQEINSDQENIEIIKIHFQQLVDKNGKLTESKTN